MTGRATRRRPGAPPRPLTGAGLAVTRQLWRDLIDQARRRAKGDLDGVVDTLADRVLTAAFNRTAGNALPINVGESAKHARGAFVEVGRGFLLSAGERRNEFARLLIAAADLLDRLFDEQQRDDARTWQRQFGED